MIVHDDGCVCEFCMLIPEAKKKCPTFRFVTGLQRSAGVLMTPLTELRIEVVTCPFAHPDSGEDEDDQET